MLSWQDAELAALIRGHEIHQSGTKVKRSTPGRAVDLTFVPDALHPRRKVQSLPNSQLGGVHISLHNVRWPLSICTERR